MGFFESLRRTLGGHPAPTPTPAPTPSPTPSPSPARSTGNETTTEFEIEATTDYPVFSAIPEPFVGGEYDRQNWRKKLKRVLGELPASRAEWPGLLAEANALGIDPELLHAWTRDEFDLLVRRVVSDRVVTEAEHRTLDLARELMGIPDAEAETILRTVAGEAERFFGQSVEGA